MAEAPRPSAPDADEAVVVEEPYVVPTHLRAEQTVGLLPQRLLLSEIYPLVPGVMLAGSTWNATHLVLPSAVALVLPSLLMTPFALPLKPGAEHGAGAMAGFVGRTFVAPKPVPPRQVAIWRMSTLNLETASVAQLRAARAQWGSIVNALKWPIKIIIRGRPLSALGAVSTLMQHANPAARELGEWLQAEIGRTTLIERDRLLVVPAADEAELAHRAGVMEQAFRKARLVAQRIEPADVPMVRTLTWDPHATVARDAPHHMEEGWTEVLTDGWWTRAYALADFPPTVLTNWASSLFAGDEPMDVALDIVPQDIEYVKTWVLDVQIKRMQSSVLDATRMVALEQLLGLRMALEKRRVAPFEVSMTVLVQGTSKADVQARAKKVVTRVESTGAKLKLLRWEQAAGLRQLDPAQTTSLPRRKLLVETGTVARTYPFSDAYLQLPEGVPWGDAGNRPCLFTPWVRGNRGPHMAWYGTTNAGKTTGARILWSRLHLLQNVRIFGIDQDERLEYCGRFVDYLHGRREKPRDAQDVADLVLHPDDGVVVLNLSEIDDDDAGPIYAEWQNVVKRHMLAYPSRALNFVDEATRVAEDASGKGGRALRESFQRGRRWWSSHALTQRPSDWFNTRTGRAVQGNCDAWWCGAQQPRELKEVAHELELTPEEYRLVRGAGIGEGMLVSGMRRVMVDLYDKVSPSEAAAFFDEVSMVTPISSARKEGVA